MDVTGIFGWLGKGANFAGTRYGQSWLAPVSMPVFGNVEDMCLEELKIAADDKKAPKGNPIVNAGKMVYNHFAWGDILSIGGVGLWWLHDSFMKSNGEESFISKAFKWLAITITAGGFISARVGQGMGLHTIHGLGAKYSDYAFELFQKMYGKEIFKQFTDEDINSWSKYGELLEYTEDGSSTLKGRHALKDASKGGRVAPGGFVYGRYGTGKTAGVKDLIYRWRDHMNRQNFDPKAFYLDINGLAVCQEKISKEVKDMHKALGDENANITGVVTAFKDSQALIVLENLVRRIKTEKEKITKYNQSRGTNKEQVGLFFVDEFDKICDFAALAGCDKQKLDYVIQDFAHMFNEGDVILNSNLNLEEFIKKLEPYVSENTIGMLRSRFGAKKVHVKNPDEFCQSRISAGYLLTVLSPELLCGFDVELKEKDNFHRSKAKLAQDGLLEVHSQSGVNHLTGRHIEMAISEMESSISTKVNELAIQHDIKVSDDSWINMTLDKRVHQVLDTVKDDYSLNIDKWGELKISEKLNYLLDHEINSKVSSGKLTLIKELSKYSLKEKIKLCSDSPLITLVVHPENLRGALKDHQKESLIDLGITDKDSERELITTKIMKSYFAEDSEALKGIQEKADEVRKAGKTPTLFELLEGKAYDKEVDENSAERYKSKSTVKINGNDYAHVIVVHPKSSDGKQMVEFRYGTKNIRNYVALEHVDIERADFEKIVKKEIATALRGPDTLFDLIGRALKQVFSNINSDDVFSQLLVEAAKAGVH